MSAAQTTVLKKRPPATLPVTASRVALIPGDGIGPEIAAAVRKVFAAAGAPVEWEVCDAGASVFGKGIASGLPAGTIDCIRRNRVVLKGPLETQVGSGGKSANVTLRKLFETYANVRPVRELPGIPSPYAGWGIDFVVVRENVEDLYAGIEHMQSPGVAQALKIVSRMGSEKVIRAAFELARRDGRRKVHCATKANILKLTEGLFKRVFEEVALEYPDIAAEHIIVDNCAHQMVMHPEMFEIVVTTNMNGDILSDLASGLVGGLGFAPSANIGDDVAIFEAVHGSAPDIAGRGIANPTATLLAAVAMLRHLGHLEHAVLIKNALLYVLERGEARTADFASGSPPASTMQFAEAVANALGRMPRVPSRRPTAMPASRSRPALEQVPAAAAASPVSRSLAGMDVFIEAELAPEAIGRLLEDLAADLPLELKMISNRGMQVYPSVGAMPDCIDVHRCRFVARGGGRVRDGDLLTLLGRIPGSLRWMHIEKLQHFDGLRGYTQAQGEN